MFARAISLSVLALPLLATALPRPQAEYSGGSPCAGAGSLQCCDEAIDSTSSPATLTLNRLQIVDDASVTGLLGITCMAKIGGTCTNQAVCCVNNSFNGVVALGCTNINISN